LRISGGTIVSQGWLRFDPYQTSCGSVPHKNKAIDSVVLITDDANRTLPLGIQRLMGDQLEASA
jgi:hypothetical protein